MTSAAEEQGDGMITMIPRVAALHANHLRFAYGDHVFPLTEACALLDIDLLSL